MNCPYYIVFMSITQTNIIDFISTSPEKEVVLTISDHLSWDEPEHLLLLQDKINTYLDFAESEQLREEYSAAIDYPILIQVFLHFDPTEEASAFLIQAKEVITTIGIGFHWKVVSDQ